ncbi:ATP-binding protein [Lyngbya sp. PCC 8106]|uniref:ATP-binding protein n=1 Tax=Lyngbya sp. (strain PCC 8106) TaxID=313612 RepID=UPI0000EAC751|nr:ATP-binding protein [Lyngbya sp. PCC 8106]EAW38802.1 Putative Anti-Sigma regulatory factor (Ser/Thr protein kinase) [Lyngbya sp. PCC 8106]
MNNLNWSNIDELPENGWGLKILFPLADELTYNRTPDNNQNCLRLVKNYDSTSEELSSQNQETSPLNRFIEPVNKFKNLFFSPSPNPKNLQKTRQQIILQVNSDIAVLEDVLAWYQQLENQPIPKPIWWQCQIALAEGFTNAVNHAHKNLPCTTPIHLQVTVFNESLEICIWDYGPPFDLKAQFNNSSQN